MFDLGPGDITEGSLGRALAHLSLPLVAQHLALVAQQVIDLFWIGRIGGDAVAAVGLVQPLLGLFVAASVGTLVGTQVLVSQRVGGDDRAGARRSVFHALVGIAVVGFLFAAVTNAVALDVTRLFDPGEEVARLAAVYLGTTVVAFAVNGMSDAVEAGFLGAGDSRTPFAVNLVAIVTNLVLDPILIFGWGPVPALGIRGAALATLVAFALGFAVILAASVSSVGGFSLARDAVGIDPAEFRELVAVGAPRAGQDAGRQFARLVVVSIVSLTGGAPALAAYTVGARIATVAFVPAQAVGSALTTIVGQNLGADRPDRATRVTWLGVGVGAVGLGAIGVVQWFVPGPIVHVFVPGLSGTALALSVAYLRILAYGYWALGAIWTVEAGFNGAGRTEVSMYSTLLQYWAVRVPVAAVGAFVLGYGALGAFWAVTVSNVVAAVGLCAFFLYSTSGGMLDCAAARATD